jgi:hypothetical protein
VILIESFVLIVRHFVDDYVNLRKQRNLYINEIDLSMGNEKKK